MKQIWKCDFCIYTGHRNDVIGHEVLCVFNPSTRNCQTCMYFDFGLRGYPSLCKISHPKFDDIYDDEKGCGLYKEKL